MLEGSALGSMYGTCPQINQQEDGDPFLVIPVVGEAVVQANAPLTNYVWAVIDEVDDEGRSPVRLTDGFDSPAWPLATFDSIADFLDALGQALIDGHWVNHPERSWEPGYRDDQPIWILGY